MKTALKILGGLIALIAIAAGVFWIGWLTPPSPEDVCNNVERITQDELGEKKGDAGLKQVRETCEKAASTPPEFGRLNWVNRLKCMRDAPDYDALKGCETSRRL